MAAPPRSSLIRAALCVLAAATAWVLASQVTAIRQASNWLDDVALAYAAPALGQRDDIIVLAVTEDTLAQLPYRSPLSRRLLAETLDELARRNVRAVGIDVIFDQPTVAADDEALLAALAQLAAPVVLAAGSAADGLTPRQLEFQDRYLAGHSLGSASVYLTDGAVRELFPRGPSRADRLPSFPAALAAALGLSVDPAPQRLRFRTAAADGTPPLRKYPLHQLALLPAAWFDGATILIGADLPNVDRYRTPLSVRGDDATTMAGVEIHAQALAQLLDAVRYPSPAPGWAAALLLVTTVAGFLIPLLPVNLLIKIATAAAALVAYPAAAIVTFATANVALPILMPALGFVLGIGFSSAYARYRERADRRLLQRAFEHYVAPPVIAEVIKDPSKLALGGEEREMSFVFSDLSGFTTLSEQLTPAGTVSLLQDYFAGMLDIALELGGTVDRLVGDSVLVFFGAPMPQADHARRAVLCALAWDRFCDRFRREQLAHGVPMGVTRIGVHTGVAVVGNVGSARRFQYTVHGDSVNVAARLERVNKQLGTRACLSTAAARHFPEGAFRPVGHLILKGKTQGLECVTVAEGMAPEELEAYRMAYELMQARDPGSAQRFKALVERMPQDVLVRFHADRLERGEAGATIVLEEK